MVIVYHFFLILNYHNFISSFLKFLLLIIFLQIEEFDEEDGTKDEKEKEYEVENEK